MVVQESFQPIGLTNFCKGFWSNFSLSDQGSTIMWSLMSMSKVFIGLVFSFTYFTIFNTSSLPSDHLQQSKIFLFSTINNLSVDINNFVVNLKCIVFYLILHTQLKYVINIDTKFAMSYFIPKKDFLLLVSNYTKSKAFLNLTICNKFFWVYLW